jgi:quercetin dioxygenase-like cupin family protein
LIRVRCFEESAAPMVSGDVAVIPGNTEHEGIFPEDTEVIDIFAPPREDFLTSEMPHYMRTP